MPRFDPAQYETVDDRIKRFYTDHPSGRIRTKLVRVEGDVGKTRWVVKASVWREPDEVPDGTGYAFEVDGSGGANQTSALENCETSAIGRALANIGYSGAKRPTREEMRKTEPAAVGPVGQPPATWKRLVAAAQSKADLQALYDGEAHAWFTDEVRAAFTARKAELDG